MNQTITTFDNRLALFARACAALCCWSMLSMVIFVAGCTTLDASPSSQDVEGAIPSCTVPSSGSDHPPDVTLGVGDEINIQVVGRPELSAISDVAPDGTILLSLVGHVSVGGLSQDEASARIASALRDGEFVKNPQVMVRLSQSPSQKVSVLGDVKAPAQYPIDSRTTIFDLLAQAGGITENGADVVYLIAFNKTGQGSKCSIDLKGLNDSAISVPNFALKGGDSIYVPRAGQFYIFGEVQSPNMYRLEPGMTVLQAISRGGGVTQRGSTGRIEIKRRDANGQYMTIPASLVDLVRPNDVVRVKERFF